MSDQMDIVLDLLRRLPPQRIASNLDTLVALCPDLAEELYSSVDQPLQVRADTKAGREYLACDYNRDGDSYRSPWTNDYDPPLPDGTIPSAHLRKLEIAANEAFDTYRQMYFEGGYSSVYLWDLDDGFAGVILLKKELHGSRTAGSDGSWDSLHVFEATERGRSAHYKLTSTVMLALVRSDSTSGKDAKLGMMDLSGSLTRQHSQDWPLTDATSHIPNIGRMVEEMESKMRNQIQEVYFGKTRDIVSELRSRESLEKGRRQRDLQKELMGLWGEKK